MAMIRNQHSFFLSLSGRNLFVFLMFFFPLLSSVQAGELPASLPAKWTVSEAVNFALVNNPDANIARQRIASARAAIDQAQSVFFPSLGVNVEYGQTNNPMYSFGNILNHGAFNESINFNDPGITDNLRLAATLKYRLYNGGRNQAGLRAARAKHLIEKQQKTAILSELAFQVVRSFYTIVQAEEIVDARKSALSAITASLSVAKARFEAGDLLKASMLDIEVQRSAAHEQLIEARHGLNLGKRAFLNLLGLQESHVQLDLAQHFPQQAPKVPDGSLRPELQSLEAAITAAREQLAAAEGGYLPTADLFGSYQVDQGFRQEETGGNSWIAGVRLNYTFYEGNRTAADVAATKADLTRAQEIKRKMQLAIGLEIEQARLALQQAEERLEVTKKMTELALESARLSREQFREGVILSSNLIDAENRLTDARVHSSLAKTAKVIAIADLRRAAGLAQFQEKELQKATDTPSSIH